MEEKYTSVEMKDYIVDAGAETLSLCMNCGLCTAVCPWRMVPGHISGVFKIRHMQRLGQMGMEGFEDEDVLFACTTCGMCQSNCPRSVKVIDNVRVMRSTLVEAGVLPGDLKSITGSAHANGNPWSGPREERTAWQEGLDIPAFGPDTEYFLFVCCLSAYEPRSKNIAKSIVDLLKKAGVSFGVIGNEESCCGESMRKIGDEELWQRLAQSNINLFKEKGVKKIITTSPHCLYTFRDEYPSLEGEFEVIHYTELLANLIKEGKLKVKNSLAKKVAFHDPCYLGRHSKIYDEPRDLLKAISEVELIELEKNRELSLCCAGGGGRIWGEVPMGERFGELRINDAVEKGIQVLTTSCPYCVNMLEDACKSLNKDDVLEVKDITEVLSPAT